MSKNRTLTRRQAHGVFLTAALGTAGIASAITTAAVSENARGAKTLAAAEGANTYNDLATQPKSTTSTKVRLASAPRVTAAQASTSDLDPTDFAQTLAGNARVQLKGDSLTHPKMMSSVAQVTGLPARRVHVGTSNMVAATWTGPRPDLVALRSQQPDGTWTEWLPLANVSGPDSKPVNATEPAWIGESQAIDIRAIRDGRDVTDLVSLVTIHSPETPDDSIVTATAASTSAANDMPTVVSRAGWGCDESLRNWGVSYGATNQLIALHHAEGTNSYTQSQAASQVRGIYYYHAVTLGWGDIGYNTLVDKFGTLYEGRYGGLNKNPNGGHAFGFNSNTSSVCLLGSFQSISPSNAMIAAVTRFVGWRSGGYYHFDVNSTTSYAPTISDKWPAGVYNNFKRFLGHRDLIYTSCPGDRTYPLIAGMRGNINAFAQVMKTASYYAYTAAGGSNVLGYVYQIETQSGNTRTTVFSGGAKIVHNNGQKPIVYGENGAPIAYNMPPGVNLGFSGGPVVTGPVAPGVFFCKYSWAPDIYAVNFNGSTNESMWSWEKVTFAKWIAVGKPKPNNAGWIAGTTIKKYGTGTDLIATLNGVSHKLSWQEWQATGFRSYTNLNNQGYIKVHWAKEIVKVSSFSPAFKGSVMSLATWGKDDFPTPRVQMVMPGQYFERRKSSIDVYWVVPGAGIRRKVTYQEWLAAGSPAPRIVA